MLAYDDKLLNTTVTLLLDKKKKYVKKKKLPYLQYFVGNYMRIIISCQFYYLLLLSY